MNISRRSFLKLAGLTTVAAASASMFTGCGAKLDHRDFGPNGKIDRLTYYISVKPEDVERAKELLADLVKPEHVAPQ